LTEFEAPSFRIRERLVDVFFGLLVASATATATATGGRHRQREREARAAHRGGPAARSTARQLVLSFSLPSCCTLAWVQMSPRPPVGCAVGPRPIPFLWALPLLAASASACRRGKSWVRATCRRSLSGPVTSWARLGGSNWPDTHWACKLRQHVQADQVISVTDGRGMGSHAAHAHFHVAAAAFLAGRACRCRLIQRAPAGGSHCSTGSASALLQWAVATDGEANLCSCSRARGHGPGQGSHGVTNRSFGQSSAGKRATGVWGRPGDQTHRWALALVKSAMRLRPKGVAGLGYGRVDGHPMDERSSLRCTGIARRLHVVF
jgi:hypothetical protein